ncbi:MAG: chemotaxis protein [Caulobacter sp.]|nr:chemotaxis protein [Caulobacter sp.]
MKLMLRDYLGSLRERGELDAILPDLLSERGFNVYSRPGRGTTQHGVDIAAVGKDADGEQKVYLLSVKQGDLTRQDWDTASPQALRPSLNEILDVYIPTRIPPKHRHLRIVICICLGGDVHESVRSALSHFTAAATTDQISFEEWNGDHIAEMLDSSLLREELLPKELRSNFQKAVAMLDEPSVSVGHFDRLLRKIVEGTGNRLKDRLTSLRQIYVCVWVMFVWARDAENLEAAYRASETAILASWQIAKPNDQTRNSTTLRALSIFDQIVILHSTVSADYLNKAVLPFSQELHALSVSVNSQSRVDINLALFEILGRLGMAGTWLSWHARNAPSDADRANLAAVLVELGNDGIRIINNNPTLFLPSCDTQTTSLMIFLLFYLTTNPNVKEAHNWISQMALRLDLTLRTHGFYPMTTLDYRELIEHPRERTDAYRKEVFSGSTLIPILAIWLRQWQSAQALEALQLLVDEVISECTLQTWVPDADSEELLWFSRRSHGFAVCDLTLKNGGNDLVSALAEACKSKPQFSELSAIRSGYWPVAMLAFKFAGLPVPPHLWLPMIDVPEPAKEETCHGESPDLE